MPVPSSQPTKPTADLPAVSFTALTSPDPAVSEPEISRLLDICENTGFFYLTDHQVPSELMHRVIEASRSFFLLPDEVKQRYNHDSQFVTPNTCRGYTDDEALAGDIPDTKELFDLGVERPLVPGKRFSGPNHLPSEDVSPDFAKSHLDIQKQVMERLVPVLHRSLAKALGKDEHFFEPVMSEPTLIQRAVFYPPQVGTAGKHTDSCLFTVLMQEQSEHRSLQVYARDAWMTAEAREDLFVINIGDMLQYWTNKRFTSTAHQVHHHGRRSRVSLPFFVYPNYDAEIVPVGETDDSKTVRVADIINRNFDSIWIEKAGAGRAKELV